MLSERKILLGSLIAYAALGVLAVAFLYIPNIARRNRNLEEVRRLDREIRDLRALTAGIEQLRRKVVESEKDVALFNSQVARHDSLYYLIREIVETGRTEYRLEFVEVRPPSKDTLMLAGVTAPLVGIPYQFQVRGRYLDIGRFIESLDNFRYFVRVPEFEIIGKDEIRPFVEARLLINIFATKATGAKS